MGEQETPDLRVTLKTQGVWKSVERRLGQNQLYGTFLNNPRGDAVTPSDPTDNALAAIASILDTREPAPPSIDDPAPPPAPSEPIEADGYSKTGPGPLADLRFKWTVRSDDEGNCFVDETIGSSRPIIRGPMSRDAAIALVDESERTACTRFETLRREITTTPISADTATTNPTPANADPVAEPNSDRNNLA